MAKKKGTPKKDGSGKGKRSNFMWDKDEFRRIKWK